MTPAGEQAYAVVATALGIVLRLDAREFAASTRLTDLGADSLVLVSLADIAEAEVHERGWPRVVLDDATLVRAVTVGDLASSLAAAMCAPHPPLTPVAA